MNKIKIAGGCIEIIQGDIALQDTDAVVNAANNVLWMGSGVAGAIKRMGGEEIETEAVSLGPIRVGGAVSTGAGKLKAGRVIHAAAMGQDLSTNAELVKEATLSALEIAEEEGLSSVSLPALGTGVGGFPIDACADLMLKTSVEFLQSAERVKILRFVLFSEGDFKAFESALRRIFSA